jgi:hypothetical protein
MPGPIDSHTNASVRAGASRPAMSRWLRYQYHRRIARRPVSRPAFIIGCGRSGTTILGRSLSHHPAVTYLNEQRDVWVAAYPVCDIWSEKSPDRAGRLRLTAADVNPQGSDSLRTVLNAITKRERRPQLLEKLPINSYRVDFLATIFPDGRFIHLVRDGVAVARSISQMTITGRWFGHEDYKWKQLRDFALTRPQYRDLPEQCDTMFARGLLEWRMSVEVAREDLAGLPQNRWMEIRYEDFISNPARTAAELEAFIGLTPSKEVEDFVSARVRPQRAASNGDVLSPIELAIGGPLLEHDLSSRA